MPDPPPVTRLLQAANAGDPEALDALYGVVYQELHRRARMVRRGRAGDTLNTTALVHEAYLKLMGSEGKVDWNNRLHFFRVAARAMRQVLVNAAQYRARAKRGGGRQAATFNEAVYSGPVVAEQVLALDEALTRLEQTNPRQAQVVECRFFAGLSIEETAAALHISDSTVKREWRVAQATLYRALQSED